MDPHTFHLKQGGKRRTIQTAKLRIGTSAECEIYLTDSAATFVHAEITHEGGQYMVADCGTLLGTWLNGSPVEGRTPFQRGDELVVGTAKIRVAYYAKKEVDCIEVDVDRFFFEQSTGHKNEAGEDVVRGDAERLVEDEVSFGRFRALSAACMVALIAGVGFTAALGSPKGREALLQPGDLAGAHGQLFGADHGSDASAFILKCAEKAKALGCAACHEPFGTTSAERCANCHGDLVEQRHPFYGDLSKLSTRHDISSDKAACGACHMDHQGASPADGTFLPLPSELENSCDRCHHGTDTSELALERRPIVIEPTPHEIPYDSFPHDRHGEIRCDVCHEPSSDGISDDRDFTVVPFETCMKCHSADETATESNPWARIAGFADAPAVPAQLQVRLSWHGSGTKDGADATASKCITCHDEVFSPDLRRSETLEPDGMLAFAIKRRAHVHEFESDAAIATGAGTEQRCIECHKSGTPVNAGQTIIKPFFHELHMRSVAANTQTEAVERSAQCEACHTGRAASNALAATTAANGDVSYQGPQTESCAQCHYEDVQGNQSPLVIGAQLVASPAPRERVQFPHDVHIGSAASGRAGSPLADGCFECHLFEPGDPPFSSAAGTHADAANCMQCHEGHRNVGGVAEPDRVNELGCALCHSAPDDGIDPVWEGKPAIKMRAPTPGFSHWSRGHAPETDDAGSCVTCHAGVENAKTVRDVPIPSEADATCFECHIQKQFHWRGAPSSAVK